MKPCVELLESRDTPSTLGTIGNTVTYAPDALPNVEAQPEARQYTDGHLWQVGRAYDQQRLEPGVYDVWHGVWSDGPDDLAINYGTMTRFVMPDARAVGIAFDGSTVTVYQHVDDKLWSVTSTDAGETWGAWVQEAVLVGQDPSGQASVTPFGYLAALQEPSDFLSPPEPVAAVVYGKIVKTENAIYVGFMESGVVYAGKVSGGAFSTTDVDAFFADPLLWQDQTSVL